MYKHTQSFGILAALLFGLIGTTTAQETASESNQKEIELLQGDWQLVSRTTEGVKYTSGVVKKSGIKIEDDELVLYEGTFKPVIATLRSRKGTEHKQLTLTVTEGPMRGETLEGIYMLKGDELSICFTFDNDMPESFEAPAGKALEVFKLRKKKDSPK